MERFDQPGFKVYQNIQALFLNAVRRCPYEYELSAVCEIYDDINKEDLGNEIPLFARLVADDERENFGIGDLIGMIQKLTKGQKALLKETTTLAKTMLVMPATNAESEQTFSAMKRIKTYMRATTSDNRLNHLMVMHVHREELDRMDHVRMASEFVLMNSEIKVVFGTFSKMDLPKRKQFISKATQWELQQG